LLVHLLDQRRIPRETARIQFLHLIDQRLQLLPRLGAVLHGAPNLIKQIQALLDLTLRISRIRTLLRSRGAPGNVRIARVEVPKDGSVAIAATRISCRARDAVADLTTLPAATLSTLLAALTALLALAAALLALPALLALTTLPTLTALLSARLAIPRQLLALPLLSRAPSLTLSLLTLTLLPIRLPALTSAQARQLIAQPR
jgi:hypothetical protein